MDGPKGYYAKWNKSDRERQIMHGSTYMWTLKRQKKNEQIQQNINRLIETGTKKVVAGWEEAGDGWKSEEEYSQ